MGSYRCGETHQVYKNGTQKAKEITLTVTNKCGGHTTVTVVDINSEIVNDALLSAPSGVVTMTVNPDHRLRVLCAGDENSKDGCQVDIATS
jgi:hypothetical protein